MLIDPGAPFLGRSRTTAGLTAGRCVQLCGARAQALFRKRRRHFYAVRRSAFSNPHWSQSCTGAIRNTAPTHSGAGLSWRHPGAARKVPLITRLRCRHPAAFGPGRAARPNGRGPSFATPADPASLHSTRS